MQEVEVIICTPRSVWGEFLVEKLLKRDLEPPKNKKYRKQENIKYSLIECSRAELYAPSRTFEPHTIVCDFNGMSVNLTCRHLHYLRAKFPSSGLVIAHEDEDVEDTADVIGACMVYSDLMRYFIHYPKGSRRFLEAAQVRLRRLEK